ncbi:MAG: hypothetical protein U9R25_02625 [Chloroflexota bacterium]|nr:hypothetical protein [Chloroflexota bacterium]
MTRLRTIVTVDKERNIRLPEGTPFKSGEQLYLLWDGRTLQISRRKPRQLSDAFDRVQTESEEALDTDAVARRLADDENRKRNKFDDALKQFFKE